MNNSRPKEIHTINKSTVTKDKEKQQILTTENLVIWLKNVLNDFLSVNQMVNRFSPEKNKE